MEALIGGNVAADREYTYRLLCRNSAPTTGLDAFDQWEGFQKREG